MRLATTLCCVALFVVPPLVLISACEGTGSSMPQYELTDEDCENNDQVQACYDGPPTARGIYPCEDGSRMCVEYYWTVCEGSVLPADAEICDDEIDNDCNGAPDDGCPCDPGETRECYSGPPTTKNIGECVPGTQVCVDGTWAEDCEGDVIPRQEICDGVDDDCNGAIDNECVCPEQLEIGDCNAPSVLGDVAVAGSATSPAANIQLASDEDWYSVGFPPTGPAELGGGTPSIALTTGADAGYLFDVFLDCASGTPGGCSSGGSAAAITSWSFTDDQSTAGDNQWTTRDVPWPTNAYVRVHRPAGSSCDSYQLTVSR